MDSNSVVAGGFAALRRDFVRKVRQVGVLQSLKHGSLKLLRGLKGDIRQVDAFDARYGTDTGRIVSVGALDIPDEKLEHANRYEAVEPEVFDSSIRDLPLVHKDYRFVDFGSGKGRALLLASRFGFMEIIGVEISAALTKVAERNIQMFKDKAQKCSRIRVVCRDAVDYDLPREKTVFYLYHPFDGEVMRSAVSRIEKSLLDFPRKVFVVYQRPVHRIPWDRSEAFRLIHESEQYVIYESKPS